MFSSLITYFVKNFSFIIFGIYLAQFFQLETALFWAVFCALIIAIWDLIFEIKKNV